MVLKLSNQLTGTTSNQTKRTWREKRDTAQPISINCTVSALLIPYNIDYNVCWQISEIRQLKIKFEA